jgi:diguanylate cyclase (GGDEF)-like protein
MVPMNEATRLLPQTIESIGFALANAALETTHCPAAVVVRDPATHVSTVVALSVGTDRRLLGMPVSPDSAAVRACDDDTTTYAVGVQRLLGDGRTDRRRREERGVAFALSDGRHGVGALVVFAPPELIDRDTPDHLMALTREAGLAIGSIVAARFAERLGLIDTITGHANRPGLEQAMHGSVSKQCSLVCLSLDQIQQLEKAVANAVLRQVAALLRSRLRDYDVPARVTGGEFALFLPDAPLDGAVIVADRVRSAVSQSKFDLNGAGPLTCSLGVASIPDTVSSVDHLLDAASKARREARASGPNRIASLNPS